jgi:hypothetical protein
MIPRKLAVLATAIAIGAALIAAPALAASRGGGGFGGGRGGGMHAGGFHGGGGFSRGFSGRIGGGSVGVARVGGFRSVGVPRVGGFRTGAVGITRAGVFGHRPFAVAHRPFFPRHRFFLYAGRSSVTESMRAIPAGVGCRRHSACNGSGHAATPIRCTTERIGHRAMGRGRHLPAGEHRHRSLRHGARGWRRENSRMSTGRVIRMSAPAGAIQPVEDRPK